MKRPGAGVGLAHVDQLDRRHPQAVDPARQLQPRQLQPRLRPRRRGAGDQHGAAVLDAAAGDRAGVVAGVALLLVGGVVLLVDHDQAEVANRREDGGPGADADAGLAAAQAPPLVVALAAEAGAAAHPVHDVPRPAPALRRPAGQVRQDRRRRDGQVPPARRRRRSTTPWSAWPRTGSCACRSSTARATSAPSTATRRPPTATPRPSSTAVADHLMRELRQDTVDMRPNYDNETQEPVVLPAAVPEPARQRHRRHRRRHGDQHPAAQPRRGHPGRRAPDRRPRRDDRRSCWTRVKGPDFPLGGKIVTDRAHAAQDLRGRRRARIKVQAEWKLEEADSKVPQIVITSIPYGVEQGQARERHRRRSSTTRKLPQLLGLTNESNEKDGLRIALEMQAGHRPEPGDGLPLQAHRPAGELRRST